MMRPKTATNINTAKRDQASHFDGTLKSVVDFLLLITGNLLILRMKLKLSPFFAAT